MNFKQWLDQTEAIWGSKIKLHNYNHYLCNRCGQTLDDSWVKSMGWNCSCGGKLTPIDPEGIEKNDDTYKMMAKKRPLHILGSSK